MTTSKTIPVGSVIHKEKPFVYCLSSSLRTENCDFCFKRTKCLKCAACQYVYYCNKVCQREAWTEHKTECKSLKRVSPRIVPDAARMLAKLIRKLSRNGNSFRSYYTPVSFRMFKDLMSHYPRLKSDSRRMEHFESICGVLREFMRDEILPNNVELLGMFGRLCINSFNICNDELQTLGTGIYLAASILDHSCKPNAVAIFEGPTLIIKALKTFDSFNWSKVYISYIDVLNTRENRIKELERVYYFTCKCPRCIIPDPIEMNAAKCPNAKCDNPIDLSVIDMTNCSKCGSAITQSLRDCFNEVNELTDLHLMKMNELAYLDACKLCLSKQEGVLHSLNIKKVKTLDLAFESSIVLGKFDESVEIGFKLIEPFHKYYGKFQIMTGLLHLKLGKILAHLDKQDEAIKHTRAALEILKITHGTGSNLFKEQLLPAWTP